MEIWIPYGDTEVCATVYDRNLLGVIKPRNKPGAKDPVAEINRALNNPIGTDKKLADLAKKGKKIAIVVDDHTRPAPSQLMLPPILERLNKAGVSDGDITVIVGGGSHRPSEKGEIKKLVGDEVLKRVKVVTHDSHAKDLVYFGDTSLGTKVYVNKTYAEADVKILTGDINFHYYGGYGGGRKSLLPAIAGYESIQHNHKMLTDPKARAGNLAGNPIQKDMMEAAKMVGVDFILNVVENAKGKIVKAFGGHYEKAFLEGVKLVDRLYKVPVKGRAKIVLVSPGGAPYDINLYQALKAVENAIDLVKPEGVIVLAAECTEGHGHDEFYRWMTECKTVAEAEARTRKRFVIGGFKAFYLLRALSRAHIILVSALPDYYARNVFRMDTAKTVDDGMSKAFKLMGRRSKVWVLPKGTATLPLVTR